ncbi:MAG: hypothetical protein ACJ77D_14075 [Chloroflexota bacterium]|jgi:hypothetical protein
MIKSDSGHTRRAVLAAAAGAAVATVASAIDRPASVLAGSDGDVVLGSENTSMTETVMRAEWGSKANVLRLIADDNGDALIVGGKMRLERSGRAKVLAGKSTVDVDLRPTDLPFYGLEGTPLCFATLMTYRAGVFVTTARPNYPIKGKIRIYLNRAVPADTFVSWVVLN